MEFALIIKFILIGMMIFSAISYMFQRSDHKQSLKNAINNLTLGNKINRLFSTLSEPILSTQLTQLQSKLGEQQQNNTSLALILTHAHFAEINTAIDSANSYDSASKVRYYYDILALAAGHVDLYGLVNKITYQEDGSIASLSIHSDYRYKLDEHQLIPASLVNIVLFMIILAVTIIQVIIWFWKVTVNKRRLASIKNDYRNLVL